MAIVSKPFLVGQPQGSNPHLHTITWPEGALFGYTAWQYPGGYEVVMGYAQYEEGGRAWTYPILVLQNGIALPAGYETWVKKATVEANDLSYDVYEGPSKQHPGRSKK